MGLEREVSVFSERHTKKEACSLTEAVKPERLAGEKGREHSLEGLLPPGWCMCR